MLVPWSFIVIRWNLSSNLLKLLNALLKRRVTVAVANRSAGNPIFLSGVHSI